jgi:hypothetical protein
MTWTAKETGRSVTIDVIEFISILDGRIASIRIFPQDTHALLETLQAN